MAERDHPGGERFIRRERKDEPPPYLRAARFPGEQPAGQAYKQAQEAIYSGPRNDLSAYRLILNQVYHLAVLGQTPPAELQRKLEGILATGEPAELPPDVLKALADRRRQSLQHGQWVERHFRPGRRL